MENLPIQRLRLRKCICTSVCARIFALYQVSLTKSWLTLSYSCTNKQYVNGLTLWVPFAFIKIKLLASHINLFLKLPAFKTTIDSVFLNLLNNHSHQEKEDGDGIYLRLGWEWLHNSSVGHISGAQHNGAQVQRGQGHGACSSPELGFSWSSTSKRTCPCISSAMEFL